MEHIMSIDLHSKNGAKLAQTLQIREHHLVTDISVAEGGEDEGPNPHDLYDAALGACKALTLMWFARKKAIDLTHIDTMVEHDASEERQGIYRLKTQLILHGNFSEGELAQMTAVAEKCPVHKLMTSVTTEITTQVKRASDGELV
jgi:putative redox protein